jgi:hypothetical protein
MGTRAQKRSVQVVLEHSSTESKEKASKNGELFMVFNYYNRFQASKNYEKALFFVGRGLQSAELNEIQEFSLNKLKALGDAIFKDGDVVSGCDCIVQDGSVTVEAGNVYLRGAVRSVPSATLEINDTQRFNIGLYLKETTVTELEDPTLRDPAVGARNYQEAGAARMQYSLTWAAQAEGSVTNAELGDFYPVYVVDLGVLILKSAAPELDSVKVALARYDRESNGSYIVRGFDVKYHGVDDGQQVFVLNEGKAHVDGYEIELPHSLRLKYELNPDLSTVQSEPHTFQSDGQGNMRIILNNPTCHSIQVVDVTKQKTANLTHGAFSGASDQIPDQAILEIVQVRQGGTVYVQGTDFRLQSGAVDWSLAGDEVSPCSSYEVTYRARVSVAPTDVTETGLTVSNAVPGTLVLIDYTWKMPRYDLITIDKDGKVQRIQGQAHPWRPSIPKAPGGQLALAYVAQTWKAETKPDVISTAIHAISMTEIQAMKNAIADLYDFVAEERLKNDANARDPAAKKGLFVDPFFDDDMRDNGIEQSAAIVDQCLQLPISVTVVDSGKSATPWMLPFVLETVVEQPLRTGSMKINPYQAFDPLPAVAKMILDTDRWTEVQTVWNSSTTGRFSTTSSSVLQQTLSNSVVVSRNTEEAATMRSIPQKFTVEGLKPGENITIIFDGIEVEGVA